MSLGSPCDHLCVIRNNPLSDVPFLFDRVPSIILFSWFHWFDVIQSSLLVLYFFAVLFRQLTIVNTQGFERLVKTPSDGRGGHSEWACKGGGTFSRCLWHTPTEVSTDLQEAAGKGSDEEGLAQGNRALPDPRTGKLQQGRGDRDRSTAGRGSRSSSHALPRASARPAMLKTASSVERMAAPV